MKKLDSNITIPALRGRVSLFAVIRHTTIMGEKIVPYAFIRSIQGIIFLLLLLLARPPAVGATTRPPPGAENTIADRTASEATGENRGRGARAFQRIGWSGFAQGGYLYQFQTYSDGGGSFSVNRFFVQTGASYAPDLLRSVSLAVGYGFDTFQFSGSTGFAALRPWKIVHSWRISMPLRWGFDKKWTLLLIPTMRASLEDDAAVKDSLLGGGFAGFFYRFGDRLTIGPGIGVSTEIEDSPTVFPVLLIDWKISKRFSLSTGRGVGATLGPGLVLSCKASEKWDISIGGRFEKLRFRLNGKAPSPNGVGEDRSFPLFAGVTYNFVPMGHVRLAGGVELGEEHRLEDPQGNLIAEEYYDPAGFIGLSFSIRF